MHIVDGNGNVMVSLGTKIAGEDSANDLMRTQDKYFEPLGANTSASATPVDTTNFYDNVNGYDLRGYRNMSVYFVNTTNIAAVVTIQVNLPGFGWVTPFSEATNVNVPAGGSTCVSVVNKPFGLTRVKYACTGGTPTSGNLKVYPVAM